MTKRLLITSVKISDSESVGFHIFLGLASIPVALTLVGLVYLCWTRACCNLKSKCRVWCKRTVEKEDINNDYGTYSRGWYEEGDYGDGDKVYVTDTNECYER